jgi:hypothetical protein
MLPFTTDQVIAFKGLFEQIKDPFIKNEFREKYREARQELINDSQNTLKKAQDDFLMANAIPEL